MAESHQDGGRQLPFTPQRLPGWGPRQMAEGPESCPSARMASLMKGLLNVPCGRAGDKEGGVSR